MKPQPSLVEEHLAVQRILPWYVTGMLHADDETMVAQHLARCAACRADVALEQRLLTGVAADDPLPEGLDAEAALARLMPRLDGVQGGAEGGRAGTRQAGNASATPWRSLWQRVSGAFGGGWRNWALAAQGALIVGLGVLLMPADPAYRALGSGAAATPDVVVVFQPDARAGHVQQVLQASGARIVDGPTVTGAYLLDVDAAHQAQLLAALRADPAVRLAEPLGAGAAP